MQVRTVTPAIEYAAKYATTIQRKFEDQDLKADAQLITAVEDYLREYTGKFDFVLDVAYKNDMYGRLSIGQLRGVLNCLRAEVLADSKPKPVSFMMPAMLRYTITHPDGTWTTIRLAASKKHAGTAIASFLYGPDNETDYRAFAFLKPDGNMFLFAEEFRNNPEIIATTKNKVVNALKVLLGTNNLEEYKHAYAQKEGRCCKCGRPLTVKSSIDASMGPICAMGGLD